MKLLDIFLIEIQTLIIGNTIILRFLSYFKLKMAVTVMEGLASEAVARRCSVKKRFLKILQKSQENTDVRISYLMKSQRHTATLLKKETLAKVISCQFWEVFNSTPFLTEYFLWLLLLL